MSGSKVFVDTNIIIYFLSGDKTLTSLLEDKVVHLSLISKMELLSFPSITRQEIDRIENFISQCVIVDLNESISQDAIEIRRKYKLKLPDSIIIASANFLDLPLLSADKALEKIKEVKLIQYQKF